MMQLTYLLSDQPLNFLQKAYFFLKDKPPATEVKQIFPKFLNIGKKITEKILRISSDSKHNSSKIRDGEYFPWIHSIFKKGY